MYMELIRINDYKRYIRKDYVIVDLRDEEDYVQGHLEEAINLPYEDTPNLAELLRGYSQIFLYCYNGPHSLKAGKDLQKVRGKVYVLSGGIQYYRGKLVK